MSVDLASLQDIHRAKALVEGKLSLLIMWIVEVEKRVEWLKDMDKKGRHWLRLILSTLKLKWRSSVINLKVLKSSSDMGSQKEGKLQQMQKLLFVGAIGGKESCNMTVLMQKWLTSVFKRGKTVQPPEIKWAHRAPITLHNLTGRPRTILVCFSKRINWSYPGKVTASWYSLVFHSWNG